MVIGDDGKPIINDALSDVTSSIASSQSHKSKDILIKMREDLAVDKEKQAKIQDQL